MRKPLLILVPLVVALVIGLVISWPSREPRDNTSGSGSGSSATASVTRAPSHAVADGNATVDQTVRRLDPVARKQLEEQIARARERARANRRTPTSAEAAPDDTIELDQVSATVKAVFEQAIPILAECYTRGSGSSIRTSGQTAAVQMTLFSDPDIGTVVDTEAMKQPDGKPLAPALDDCLRTTIESLGMPPLGVGGRLKVEYSFVFD